MARNPVNCTTHGRRPTARGPSGFAGTASAIRTLTCASVHDDGRHRDGLAGNVSVPAPRCSLAAWPPIL
eukprot:8495099-Alexandrium_andersonii.AAC.1